MPWEYVKLNDGREICSIGFGVWKVSQADTVGHIKQALATHFDHIDTAQAYRNEQQVGDALKEVGFDRSKIWVTTKYSAIEGKTIEESIDDSLRYLGLDYVDLYLLHSPNAPSRPDIPTAWSKMEKILADGKAKSIGVSNYKEEHLKILLASAKVKPVVNQIEFHPEVLDTQLPIHEFGNKHGILTEAYSLLIPIVYNPKGAVATTVDKIAARLNYTNDQILMAWAHAKGAIVVTTSSKVSRLEGYQNAGDIQLSDDDIAAIDASGATASRRRTVKSMLHRAVVTALTVAAILRVLSYYNVHVL